MKRLETTLPAVPESSAARGAASLEIKNAASAKVRTVEEEEEAIMSNEVQTWLVTEVPDSCVRVRGGGHISYGCVQ